VLRADPAQDASIAALAGRKVVAFTGIAIPEKFFTPLRQAGAVLTAARPFPDHHNYTARDLDSLVRLAKRHEAVLVTTPKDAVRLPQAFPTHVTVIGVSLAWHEPRQIDQLLARVIALQP
jgi:tetraacyldisaccharide 4'-kinase